MRQGSAATVIACIMLVGCGRLYGPPVAGKPAPSAPPAENLADKQAIAIQAQQITGLQLECRKYQDAYLEECRSNCVFLKKARGNMVLGFSGELKIRNPQLSADQIADETLKFQEQLTRTITIEELAVEAHAAEIRQSRQRLGM
jgi:hypothetical protein